MILRRFFKLCKILLANNKYWNKALLKYKVAPAIEHKKFISNLKIDTIIDVGANRGQFALLVKKTHPHAKIYSFEPLKSAYCVYKSIFINDPSITIFNCALSYKSGQQIFHVSQQEDSSSLLPISKKQNDIFPGTAEKETQIIETKKLSDCVFRNQLGDHCLLKIDVQGSELEVLRGSIELIPDIEFVYVECSFIQLYKDQPLANEVIKYLQERNFTLTGIYNTHYDNEGCAVQSDFLFTQKIHN